MTTLGVKGLIGDLCGMIIDVMTCLVWTGDEKEEVMESSAEAVVELPVVDAPVDISSDQSATLTSDAVVPADETVAMATSSQSADSVVQEAGVEAKEVELSVTRDEDGVRDEESCDAAAAAEQEVEKYLTESTPSDRHDYTAAVDTQVESTDLQPLDSDIEPSTRKVDWDALERPKEKVSDAKTAEFSQVFNKVVKRKSATESRDSVHFTAERPSLFPAEIRNSSEAHFDVAAKQLPPGTPEDAGKSEHETGGAERLSSPVKDGEQVETGKSVDELRAAVEPAETGVTCESPRQLSPTADSSTVTIEAHLHDDKTPAAGKPQLQDSDINLSSPSKERSPTSKVKPCSQGTSPLSPGEQLTGSPKMSPVSEDKGPVSLSQESIKSLSSSEDALSKQQEEDPSAESHTSVVQEPSTDKQDVSRPETKMGSFHMRQANLSESSRNITVPESQTMQASSLSSGKSTPGQSHLQTNAEQSTDLPVTDDKLLVQEAVNVVPCDAAATVDVCTSDSHSVDQISTVTGECSNASRSASEQKTGAVDADSAKTSPAQQKTITARISSTKVQPSETQNDEPAWVLAAKHRSHKWTDGKAEELEKKPLKSVVADVDDEVCCCVLCSVFASFMDYSLLLFSLFTFNFHLNVSELMNYKLKLTKVRS